MDMTKIDIGNEGEGVYRIASLYSGSDSIAITSQGLLELAAWIEVNKAALEKEAAREKGRQVARCRPDERSAKTTL